MPEISRFFGIVIKMFFSDHAPPHFHAEYAEHGALVTIETLDILRGNCRAGRLPWSWNGRLRTAMSCDRTGTAPGPARRSNQSLRLNEEDRCLCCV